MSAQFLRDILVRAAAAGASDVHLTCGGCVCLRVDGELRRLEAQAPGGAEPFLALFAPFLDSTARGSWSGGRDVDAGFSDPCGCPGARFRLSGFWAGGVPAAAVRLLPARIPAPAECGFPPALQELCLRPHGLILFAGPSGSGKSTSLASLVQWLAGQRALHIVTLEDPVEYVYEERLSLIHQRRVGADVPTFAEGVRRVLREDPDVICVGEIRDAPTIGAALTAAETGHLVLATLHAPDAPRAVDRVAGAFAAAAREPVRAALSLTLRAVCAQTLVRAHSGRAAACELMTATPAVRSAIREGKTAQLKSLIQTGARDGMQSLEIALAHLVTTGRVSPDEARRHASDAEELARLCALGRART